MVDVIVKKSKIHGKGVFANRDFKPGEIILRWDTSHKLSLEKVRKLPTKTKNHVTLCDGVYTLMQSPERYINHSCNANTKMVDFCDVAKRNIKKGEEITGNYAEDKNPYINIRCTCGSKRCKKLIRTRF
ncbi:MAG: SET domain-containing protein [Candidatus Aenigmatarchaeota archaeon]